MTCDPWHQQACFPVATQAPWKHRVHVTSACLPVLRVPPNPQHCCCCCCYTFTCPLQAALPSSALRPQGTGQLAAEEPNLPYREYVTTDEQGTCTFRGLPYNQTNRRTFYDLRVRAPSQSCSCDVGAAATRPLWPLHEGPKQAKRDGTHMPESSTWPQSPRRPLTNSIAGLSPRRATPLHLPWLPRPPSGWKTWSSTTWPPPPPTTAPRSCATASAACSRHPAPAPPRPPPMPPAPLPPPTQTAPPRPAPSTPHALRLP